MALIPTKKIPELMAYGSPLQGPEMLEIWSVNTSRRVTARDFVLPSDSLLTLTGMGGSLPGSRQMIPGIGITFVDDGAGSTLSINATGAVAGPANPTALVGLAAVNGVALTYMRSDAAPALDQAIAPTWTGVHIFSGSNTRLSRNGTTRLLWNTGDAALDQKLWEIRSDNTGSFLFLTRTDADGAGFTWASVSRTGTAVNSYTVNTQVIANSTAATGSLQVNSTAASVGFFETDASAGNRLWRIRANSEQLQFGAFDDTAAAGANWLIVDRTLNVADSIALTSTALTWNGNPISTAVGANPTAQVGTAVINGVATTYMRSDAAPQINQSMAPTWTGLHTFSAATGWSLSRNSNGRGLWNILDAPADEKIWEWRADNAGAFSGRTRTDADGAGVTWISVDRTGTTVDSIALTSTALTWNGNPISTAVGANPTGTVGLTAVNGVATTFMRSDAAPALSQAIAPTWTAAHIFSLGASGATYPVTVASTRPGYMLNETDAAANNRLWAVTAQGEQLTIDLVSDAGTGTTVMSIDRTGNTVDLIGFHTAAAGILRIGNNMVESVNAVPLVIAMDGAAGLGVRNCTNDVEAFFQASAPSSLSIGTRTAHQIDVYTNNSLRFSFGNAATTTGAAAPTLSSNKPGGAAGVITWISIIASGGVQGWVPVFGN